MKIYIYRDFLKDWINQTKKVFKMIPYFASALCRNIY